MLNNELNQKNSILIVEDDCFIAKYEDLIFKNYGYNVFIANSGNDAINIMSSENSIQLILMDIFLGEGINGIETSRLILSKNEIPIIFLSSHFDDEIFRLIKEIPCYGFLLKNSDYNIIQASINIALNIFNSHKKALDKELQSHELTKKLLKERK